MLQFQSAKSLYDWQDPGIGFPLTFMFLTAIVCFIILAIIEFQVVARIVRGLTSIWPKAKRLPSRLLPILMEIFQKAKIKSKQIQLSKVAPAIKQIPSKLKRLTNPKRPPKELLLNELDQIDDDNEVKGIILRYLPPITVPEVINIDKNDDVTREKMEVHDMTDDEMRHYGVVLRNLTKYYGTFLAVNGISLKIEKYFL